MIDIFLSTDGKNTIHVAANTVEELNVLAPAARVLYEDIIKTYGTKAQMWESVIRENPGLAPVISGGKPKYTAVRNDAPLCPVHKQPMALRRGRFGTFWSCPRRLPNGQWCTATKEMKSAEEMPVKIAEQ